MAPHTLFGFAIISSALVRYNFNKWEKAWHIWSVVPSAVSFFVIIITLFAAYTVREASLEQNRKYFETLISDTEIALLSRFEQYEQSLWGGLGLFYASDHVSRDEWRRYVEALNIDVNLPGINGIGYIDFVHANDLPDYLAVTRADEADEFTNHPATNLDEKFIVKYVEPLSRNDDIIGLDIGFEEKRRTAAERARDTGEPALSRGIQLVQNQAKQATGFLLLLPVYATHNTPATIQARRQSFTGWVYANFVASRFVEDLSKIVHKEVDFQIYDGNRHDDDHRIYETQENLLPSGRFSKVTALNLAGQTWTIYWQPSAAFVPPADQSTTYFVAIFGMLFSA
ncbi:MAG: CHASE domain-containing protein, partial [Bdellovibrionales bacterium]